MPDDQFVAGRIRWRASKHNVLRGDTHEFAAAPEALRSFIDDTCAGYEVGLLVLVFGRTRDRWTVVGTRAVVSHFDAATNFCPLSEVAALTSGTPLAKKQEMEVLRVSRADSSSVHLWAPCGPEFFALWNILVGLCPRR